MLHVDKDLFAAAQAGDRVALERLLSQLRPDIQRYARFQCYASSPIEDVVQETLRVPHRPHHREHHVREHGFPQHVAALHT